MATETTRVRYAEGSAPSTPPSGKVETYAKADGFMYSKDDAGVETLMSAGVAGNIATDPTWAAAGDLIVATGNNAAAVVAIGSTNRLAKVVGGTVAWALPHCFGCIISGTSTAIATATMTSLSFGAADTYDPDGYHDPSGAPTLITVPAGLGGVYRLLATCSWPNTTANTTEMRIAYRINGGTDITLLRRIAAASGIGVSDFRTASAYMVLAAGDTVEVRQYLVNATTPQTTVNYSASLILEGVA